MKATLLTSLLAAVLTTPNLFASSELDELRARVLEQERVIRNLKLQNEQLRTARSTSSSQPAPAPSSPSTHNQPSTYTVKAGDSLGKIAKRFNTSIEELVRINRLKNASVIRIGQKIKLPATPQRSQSTVSSNSSNLLGKTHTIKEGETYFSIARKHGTSVDALIAANPSIKPTALRPGQVIRLAPVEAASTPVLHGKLGKMAASKLVTATNEPVITPGTHIPVSNTPAPAPDSAPAPEPASASADRTPAATPPQSAPAPSSLPTPVEQTAPAPEQEISSSNQHTRASEPERKIRSVSIEHEMTYGEFAKKFGTDTKRLNDLNGLDLTEATVLAKGSELYVPAQP